jgi:hypothetical protein
VLLQAVDSSTGSAQSRVEVQDRFHRMRLVSIMLEVLVVVDLGPPPAVLARAGGTRSQPSFRLGEQDGPRLGFSVRLKDRGGRASLVADAPNDGSMSLDLRSHEREAKPAGTVTRQCVATIDHRDREAEPARVTGSLAVGTEDALLNQPSPAARATVEMSVIAFAHGRLLLSLQGRVPARMAAPGTSRTIAPSGACGVQNW